MTDREAMKRALEALLIWEEMHPRTTATAVRSPAIQALQEALEQPDDAAWAKHLKEPMSEKRVHKSHTIVSSYYSGKAGDYTEQEPVGYAETNDLARDGQDFWVNRQPGKNTVPLYANPININPLTAEAWCNGYEAATKQFKRNWVGLTDEELHLKSATYANKRKEAYLNHLKKGLAKKLNKNMIDWIWVAHYEGYRDAMDGEKHGY